MHKNLAKIARVVPEIYALSVGKKTPSRRYAMRPVVNIVEGDRATDTSNMHRKFGKDRTCDSGDILADRQTDRSTDRQTDPSQTDRPTHHNTSQPLPQAKQCDAKVKILEYNSSVMQKLVLKRTIV